MDKKKLIEHFVIQIRKELEAITTAAKNTYDIATHEDNKAENKYDTRGLEASYLAGAQAQRVSEMMDVLVVFETAKIKIFSAKDPIATTALVEVSLNDKASFVFIMPKGGGQSTVYAGQSIQVITPESPLGRTLIGKNVGELVTFEAGSKTREYEIIALS
ncbi:MAG: GreA/GreB family elongation factor [Bdellovibrionaceae bacterium]|nr:GreA/GreB family elongation factor [Bdellovibrio sp.]